MGGRRLIVALLVLLALLGGAVVAAIIYDHGRQDRLAPGVRIGGVEVGGLTVDAARQRVMTQAVEPHRRTLRVHADGKTFALSPKQAHMTADIDVALNRALADSREGWLGARVAHEISGHHVNENLFLKLHYAPGVVPRLVKRVGTVVQRAPVDASVQPSATGLTLKKSHTGRVLDAVALRRDVATALLLTSRPADITAPTKHVAPKVTTDKLSAKYPAYIIIDRSDHVLRFYQHLKAASTYPIAVGMQGLETPQGLYDVQWKQTNPSWYVPNSAWAGSLAGKVIPPGPDDPIKARWMAFNGGAGIHGIDPSEYGTIGHDASHGCVRMRIPDVISLYARTPVGTPVYVA